MTTDTIYAAIKEGEFSKFQDLLKSYGAELPAEERMAMVRSAMRAIIEKSNFSEFQDLLESPYGAELPEEERKGMVRSAIEKDCVRKDYLSLLWYPHLVEFGLSPEERKEAVRSAMYSTIEKGTFENFQYLTIFYRELFPEESKGSELSPEESKESKLSPEESKEIIRSAMYATIAKGELFSFQELLKLHGSKLPDEERMAMVRSAMHAAIKKGYLSLFQDLIKLYGSKLSTEERKEIVCRAMYPNIAMHATIKGGTFNYFQDSIKSYVSELSVGERKEMVCSAMRAAIDQGILFACFQGLMEFYGSELSTAERQEMIRSATKMVHSAVYATIEKGAFDQFLRLWKLYVSELPAEERGEILRSAMHTAIERGHLSWFNILLKKSISELPAKERIETVRRTVLLAIEESAFDCLRILLTSCGSELISSRMTNVLIEIVDESKKLSLGKKLPPCSEITIFMEKLQKAKSTSLFWADDQLQEIAKAYDIKAVQQEVVKAEGEALVAEVQSISFAVDQLILAYQGISKWIEKGKYHGDSETAARIVNVNKAFADFYSTVDHAYQTFTAKLTALYS
jgi:hypothetical protein